MSFVSLSYIQSVWLRPQNYEKKSYCTIFYVTLQPKVSEVRLHSTFEMTKLYLVRHGETVDNAAQIMQGQTQGQLNEQGKRQAREVAARMEHEHIDAFVASDLHRAIETAEIIAHAHQQQVATTPLLRERDWGAFTGRYIPELKGETWPDDVESLEQLLHRARLFLNFIKDNYEGKTVVAVGHGIINKAIQAVYHGKQMKEIPRMANAEVRTLLL